MSLTRVKLTMAAVAASAVVAVATFADTASAQKTFPLPTTQQMLLTGLGTLCPGFAPFFPPEPWDGQFWWTGYFSWPAGEYLWFSSVDSKVGGVFQTEGSGVPAGYPGWTPTSGHTYKLIGRVTGYSEYNFFAYARLLVVRDDGATVAGDAAIQLEMNHDTLVTTWTSAPSCRLHSSR